MTTIISGTFETLPKAELAVQHLRGRGWNDDEIRVFHNNAPGQHAAFPIGGDEDEDPEARGAAKDALKGAAVGAGAGGLAGAVAGPLGAAVGASTGAWIGALAGALKGLANEDEDDAETRRPAGVVVAVNMASGRSQDVAERILREDGASFVEQSEGEWRAGDWRDFDPVASPQEAEDTSPGSASLRESGTETLYRIAPGGRGRWNVFEGGAGKLLSDFSTRDEAINYASALASNKQRAVVEIYRAGGELESSRAFAAPRRPGAPGHASQSTPQERKAQ